METIGYEEKYKKALERARQFIEKPYIEDSAGIVGYIFPELKESEDERIRKEIIYHIQHCDDTINEETEKRMLAWLEKQGEQPKDATYTHEVKTGNGNIKALVTEKVQLPEKYEKQGEQKQVEVRPFNTVFSQEQIDEIDKRIEKEIKLYNAKLMDAQMRAKDFPMTD